jgi:tetratricopeptide (TPR) repeat protein
MSFRYPHPDNEQGFERFCLKLLQRHWDNTRLRLYGHRGDAQLGIDIIDPSFSSPFRAAQCKHHEPDKTIPPAEIQEEVDKALTFSPPLEFYTILTTAKATVHAHNKVLEINQRHREQKLFIVELFDWGDIENLLDEYPDVAALLTPVTNAHVVQLSGVVTEGITRLETRIESATTSLQRTAFDAEIDEAESYLKNHDPQRAHIFFEKIRQRHWEELSPQQKYRVKVGFSNVALVQGKDAEAGKLLLEAKDLWPESERAQINEALGLELTGDKAGARALVTERIKAYPSASKLLAILIRTAPSECSLEDLEALVTPPHASDAEVSIALALKATESHRFGEAEAYARKAVAASPDWFGPKFLLGQALLNGEAVQLGQSLWEGPNPLDRGKVQEAVSVMDDAISLARRHQAHHCLSDSLVIRATANVLRREDKAAESDFNEAIRCGPDNASVYHRYATYLFNQSRIDEAISQLRKSLSINSVGEVEYFLAGILSERNEPGDRREATDIYVRLALAGDEDLKSDPPETSSGNARSLRLAAFHSAIEEFVDADRLDDAETFLGRIPPHRLSETAILSARSKVKLARGDSSGASTLAEEALRHVGEDTPELDLRSLALQLGKLERHKEALPLWLRINESVGYGNDVRHLVRCAERVKRFDVILKVAEATRNAGVFDPWLLFKEVETLEVFDLEKAIGLLQDRLKNHPDDKHARIRLSFLGLKWGRPELIDARPEALPSLDEATPTGGAITVDILRQHGDPNAALRYAYELVRRYPDDADANASLIKVFFDPSSRALTIFESAEVGIGAAVHYAESEDRERWVIIEDSPNPRPELGEYPPTHPLAEALIGKRVGDTVTLSKTSARDRTAVIKEILSKYVHRVREVVDSWQLRFPDQPFIQVFRVVTTDPVTGEEVPDFTDLKIVADKRFEQTSEAEATYRNQVIPLHLFAHCVGCDPFWAVHLAASKPDLVIRSNRGRDEEQTAALEALGTSHTLVLDLTALAMTSLLQLEGLLKRWRGKLVISQSTATELRSTKENLSSKRGRSGHYGKCEKGYYIREAPAEVTRAEADSFTAFVDSVLAVCEVRGCPAMAELDPEMRENLVHAFGQHGTESMLLARNPGHALWTEDITVSDIAVSEFSVRRVWAQSVLAHATNIGLISPDDYLSAVAKLLGIDDQATAFNPFVLVKAGSMSDWDAGKWPLNKALEQFANPTVPDDQVILLAAAMVVNLFKQALLVETRQATLIAILERMSARKHGLIAVRVLLSLLPAVFGVNVLAADEANGIGQAWLAEARRRPRLRLP